jgi:hypothetical protein
MHGGIGGREMASRKGFWQLMPRIKVWTFLTLYFLLEFTQGKATEYQPWLGNVHEFELRSSLLYQKYHWLSLGSHLKKHKSNDFFLKASLNYTSPHDYGLEIEAEEAWTRFQRGDIDHFKLTGRYVWLDDIAGDPLSLTTGFSLIQAFRHSLKDVSSFHHGRKEGELFLSIGKETPWETMWGSRWYSMAGIGIADRGSPWLRFNLNYENRLRDQHELRLFLHSLWGLGHKNLRLDHFHGYGPIQHQAIDIGIRYTYLLEYFGSASLEYSYRIHGRNFPVFTHRVLAQILYTFGL